MSVQAGLWHLDGKPINPQLLAQISDCLRELGPDGDCSYIRGSVALLYRPFHTTPESRREIQPAISRKGLVLTWDGRLDNREDLISELAGELSPCSTDVDIVLAAFDRWYTGTFARLVGDWAIAVWNPVQRELSMGVDFMASRHLFYYRQKDSLWWSTDVSPLVLLSGNRLHVDERYIAGYFAHQPEGHLTPYEEIKEVPPGQFAQFRDGKVALERHWRFSPKCHLRYRSDHEYEEHFRHVFRQAVSPRLRSDSPVLAELSGGIDSSSIVSVADEILAKEALTPRLDTLSYFNTMEPYGDDLEFFPKVEAKRGRTGIHIDTSRLGTPSDDLEFRKFTAFPGTLNLRTGAEEERASAMRNGGYRVVLSGIGGDELMGGIPNPSHQLADLIIQLRFITLGRELIRWGLAKRRPAIHLLGSATLELLPPSISHYLAKKAKVEPWIAKSFAARHKIGQRLWAVKDRLGMWLPSRRSCSRTIQLMGNKLSKLPAAGARGEEFRYPYLDQRLLEFILSIPASQLLRPGERRSLLCRSLVGIVPNKILSRRTKQFAARMPVLALHPHLSQLRAIFQTPLSAELGYVSGPKMLAAIEAITSGQELNIVRMYRGISLEFWLRQLVAMEKIEVGLSPPLTLFKPQELGVGQY